MELNVIIVQLLVLLSSLQAQIDELKLQQQTSDTVEIQSFIMNCESGGNPKAINTQDAKITGHASKGLFQFQPNTFHKAVLRYKLFPEGTSKEEVLKKIYDPVFNAAAAHGLIEDGEYWHWKNCYNEYLKSK